MSSSSETTNKLLEDVLGMEVDSSFELPASYEILNQGQRANFTGKNLEFTVRNLFIKADYKENNNLLKVNYDSHVAILDESHLFESQAILNYGAYEETIISTDFLLKTPKYPNGIRIECRQQSVPGSVDEKIPYMLINIQAFKIPTIMLLNGDGCRPDARNFAINPAPYINMTVEYHVWKLDEFITHFNNGFFG
jgi:hypothetical protein